MNALRKSHTELINSKLSIVGNEIEKLVNENRKYWNDQKLPSCGIKPNYHRSEIFRHNENGQSGKIVMIIESRCIESDFIQILNKISNQYAMHYFIDLNAYGHFKIVMYPLTSDLCKGMES